MQDNWVKIYSTSQAHMAEFYVALLKENEINCIQMNKMDSAYLFGEIELYVKPEDAVKAKNILSQGKNE